MFHNMPCWLDRGIERHCPWDHLQAVLQEYESRASLHLQAS